jgi:hypothetical protein
VSPPGPAGPGEVLLPPGVRPVAPAQVPGGDPAGLAADLGADLLAGADGLPALLAGRGLARPVTRAHLDELRLLAARVTAAERVADATRRRALAELAGRRGVRPSLPAPPIDGSPAQEAGHAGTEVDAGPDVWDPRPSRRRALAAVLVGIGASLVLAGFGVGFWIVLITLLAGLSLASRLLRLPAGTVVAGEDGGSGDAHADGGSVEADEHGSGPRVVSVAERLLGHHPPEPGTPDLLALAAEVPAVRATARLVEQARARFDEAYEALGQDAGPAGRRAGELVDDLAARATAPVVVDAAAAALAGRVASALPAAPVLVVGVDVEAEVPPDADEPGHRGPGSGGRAGGPGVS